MSEDGVRGVLFACTSNRTRSPLAEALARQILGPGAPVASCGVAPMEEVDPFVLAVLAEIDAPAPSRPARAIQDFADGDFEVVVSLTPEARLAAEALCGRTGRKGEYWPTPDPTLIEGPRDVVLEAYRDLRDALAHRITARFASPSTD